MSCEAQRDLVFARARQPLKSSVKTSATDRRGPLNRNLKPLTQQDPNLGFATPQTLNLLSRSWIRNRIASPARVVSRLIVRAT
jgi:hypothetical protein